MLSCDRKFFELVQNQFGAQEGAKCAAAGQTCLGLCCFLTFFWAVWGLSSGFGGSTHAHTHRHTNVFVGVCIYVCIYMCVYVSMDVCLYTRINTYNTYFWYAGYMTHECTCVCVIQVGGHVLISASYIIS